MTLTVDLYWLYIIPCLILAFVLYKSIVKYKNRPIDPFCQVLLDLLKDKNWKIDDSSITTGVAGKVLKIFPSSYGMSIYWNDNKLNIDNLKGYRKVTKAAFAKYINGKANIGNVFLREMEQLIKQELKG